MERDEEIEAMVVTAAAASGKADPDLDVYRSMFEDARGQFLAQRERIEEEISNALIWLGHPEHAARQIHVLEHTAAAHEAIAMSYPLAARLAYGGNKSYMEELDTYDPRLKEIAAALKSGKDGSSASSAAAKGGGCLGVLMLLMATMSVVHIWA